MQSVSCKPPKLARMRSQPVADMEVSAMQRSSNAWRKSRVQSGAVAEHRSHVEKVVGRIVVRMYQKVAACLLAPIHISIGLSLNQHDCKEAPRLVMTRSFDLTTVLTTTDSHPGTKAYSDF